MGYTLSVEVNSEEQAKEISEVLEEIVEEHFEENDITNTIKNISSNEHGYAPDFLDHGVYISYSLLLRGMHRSLWLICQSIAQELDTRMYYDDEEIDPYKDPIIWKLPVYSDNIFYRFIQWLVNRRSNKIIKKFEEIYNKRIKLLL